VLGGREKKRKKENQQKLKGECGENLGKEGRMDGNIGDAFICLRKVKASKPSNRK
jgi:hypothetical protein